MCSVSSQPSCQERCPGNGGVSSERLAHLGTLPRCSHSGSFLGQIWGSRCKHQCQHGQGAHDLPPLDGTSIIHTEGSIFDSQMSSKMSEPDTIFVEISLTKSLLNRLGSTRQHLRDLLLHCGPLNLTILIPPRCLFGQTDHVRLSRRDVGRIP